MANDVSGALYSGWKVATNYHVNSGERPLIEGNLSIDANAMANGGSNPMAGHAGGPDIHPYNISLLPLIAY